MSINILSEIENGVLPNRSTTQLFLMDAEKFLDALPQEPIFDLVVTSRVREADASCIPYFFWN